MSYYHDEFDLTLNGDTFNAMKSDFNQVLRKTLTNMENKGSELAELTIKLKITLKKDTAPDFSRAEESRRDIVVPKFDHKVSSVMQIKDEVTGSLGGDYELVWDEERGEYVMRKIVSSQMNIFDVEYTVANDGEGVEIIEPDAIEGSPQPLALPPAADADDTPDSADDTQDSEDDSPETGDEEPEPQGEEGEPVDEGQKPPSDADKRRAAINKALGIIGDAVSGEPSGDDGEYKYDAPEDKAV